MKRKTLERTLRCIDEGRVKVAGCAIQTTSRKIPFVMVFTYHATASEGTMAGVVPMNPRTALKLADAIRDAARVALAAAKKSQRKRKP